MDISILGHAAIFIGAVCAISLLCSLPSAFKSSTAPDWKELKRKREEALRQERLVRRQVDALTGEVIEKPRLVIIGWIDRETGEITPNPEAARIAREKGVYQSHEPVSS